jgi:GalNAc-alpha-(1->4)-GalNAc-alpha-(1->3)-diNAcBac-PP-undecaprenol alpha-1,4-N-acetyl-D-galactosaminyltransferase
MERVMSKLASRFSKKDSLDVHLVLYGSTRKIFYVLPDNITVYTPSWQFDKQKRQLHGLRTVRFLRKTITAIKPDTVLSFGEMWNNIVLLSLRGTGLAVYIADRSQPNKNLGWFQNSLRRWLYPQAAGLILQTAMAENIYRKIYPSLHIKVIGNPIKQIAETANEHPARENNILMVGRLIEGKHHDRLIKIFARINNPEWKLVLVGHSFAWQNVMEYCKDLAVQLGIGDKVIFTGEQANVEQYYLSSKIFAFTSSSEGFPNVVGEAMSAGLPVVSYDCLAGPAEMVRHSVNGFLVPVFDDVAFENSLRLLMGNENLREQYGTQAIQDMKKFAAENISGHFLEYITRHIK